MKVVLAGETGSGAMLQSLAPGLREGAEVVVVDTTGPNIKGARGFVGRVRRKVDQRRAGVRLVEAVSQLRPDVVLLVKGRGIDHTSIAAAQEAGAQVACYYPDNPRWTRQQEPGVLDRLKACDLVITFSERQAEGLRQVGARTAVVPFGYDPRWYPVTKPSAERNEVVFLGTWSRRRQRYLAALTDLPIRLVVRGTGWDCQQEVVAGPPVYEDAAGELLSRALVGINLLHPQNAGAHNMRTREITACGALQLTDIGTDGTPLRDGASCGWFDGPKDLRRKIIDAFESPAEAARVAEVGQDLTVADTYHRRGVQIGYMLEDRM